MKLAESTAAGTETLLIIDAEGKILEAREPGCLALGWTKQELVTKTVSDLIEYGADVLLTHLAPLQAAGAGANFSVSALIRKRDMSNVPTTAIVRALADPGRFGVGFEDLPSVSESNAEDATEPPSREMIAASMPPLFPEADSLDVAESNPALSIRVSPNADLLTQKRESDSENAANDEKPRFRNVYLAGAQRPTPQSNAISELTAQLEAERKERRRLEARAISLNDQLQQLHSQLKSSLESEGIYQKRVTECEETVRKIEQAKSETEAALQQERENRERIERESAVFRATQSQLESDRKNWEREWLAKIETNFAALQESDARLAAEIETRRNFQQTLRTLKDEFATKVSDSYRKEPSVPAS